MKIFLLIIIQIILFITLVLGKQKEEKDTLLSVQLTHRHGARFPINDLAGADKFKDDYEELSNVGKRELFMLGRYLNKQYVASGNLLSSVLEPREVTIYSTDRNRTIDSTNSLFQGLYPQGNGYTLFEYQKDFANPPWNSDDKEDKNSDLEDEDVALPGSTTPIAVHALDRKYLVAFDADYCTFMVDTIEENKKSQDVQDVMKQVDETLKKFCEYTGEEYPIKDFKTIYKYVDTWIAFLHISPQYDDPVLQKIVKDKQMWEDLQYCYAQYFQIIYFRNKHDNLVTSTPFVEKILDNFDLATKHPKFEKKHKLLTIYSAHDSTQAMVWRRFGLTNWECQKQIRDNNYKGDFCFSKYPIYSSQAILELWERGSDKKHIIKMRVDGEEVPVEACGYKLGGCEYSTFKEFLQKDQVEDFEKECLPLESIIDESEVEDHTPGWFIAILFCLGFVFLSIVLKIFLTRKEYRQIIGQSGLEQPLN